jgi:hypothetical protein
MSMLTPRLRAPALMIFVGSMLIVSAGSSVSAESPDCQKKCTAIYRQCVSDFSRRGRAGSEQEVEIRCTNPFNACRISCGGSR